MVIQSQVDYKARAKPLFCQLSFWAPLEIKPVAGVLGTDDMSQQEPQLQGGFMDFKGKIQREGHPQVEVNMKKLEIMACRVADTGQGVDAGRGVAIKKRGILKREHEGQFKLAPFFPAVIGIDRKGVGCHFEGIKGLNKGGPDSQVQKVAKRALAFGKILLCFGIIA